MKLTLLIILLVLISSSVCKFLKRTENTNTNTINALSFGQACQLPPKNGIHQNALSNTGSTVNNSVQGLNTQVTTSTSNLNNNNGLNNNQLSSTVNSCNIEMNLVCHPTFLTCVFNIKGPCSSDEDCSMGLTCTKKNIEKSMNSALTNHQLSQSKQQTTVGNQQVNAVTTGGAVSTVDPLTGTNQVVSKTPVTNTVVQGVTGTVNSITPPVVNTGGNGVSPVIPTGTLNQGGNSAERLLTESARNSGSTLPVQDPNQGVKYVASIGVCTQATVGKKNKKSN